MAQRVLVSLIRSVPKDRCDAYEALWRELRRAGREGGAHAWRFVSAGEGRRHIEFLEFSGGADPRGEPAARDILKRMDDEIGVAEVEEWLEKTESPADPPPDQPH